VQWRSTGLPLDVVAAACRAFVQAGRSIITVATLDNLIKGGRASFFQGWVANFLNIGPLLSFDGGEPASVGRVSASGDMAKRVDEWLADRVDSKQRVWVGIAHGDVEPLAQRTLALMKERDAVEFSMVRPLSSSIYLHIGRGSMVVFIHRLEKLPHPLTPPRV